MTNEEAINYIEDMANTLQIIPDSKIGQALLMAIKVLKTGHCKDCKFFEYDKMAMVDGIPLIIAHEICNKWGSNGCTTKENGYCFLFEPREREVRKEKNDRL